MGVDSEVDQRCSLGSTFCSSVETRPYVTRSFVWRDFAAWFGGSSEPDDEGGAGGFDDVVGDGVELERR